MEPNHEHPERFSDEKNEEITESNRDTNKDRNRERENPCNYGSKLRRNVDICLYLEKQGSRYEQLQGEEDAADDEVKAGRSVGKWKQVREVNLGK